MTRPRRSSDPVVFSTPSGRRRIKVTLGLTVGAAMAEAGSFVALGRLFDAGVSPGLAVAAIVLGLSGAAAAVTAQWLAQNGARTEEAPLRARLLRRWWEGPPERQHDERAGGLVSLMTDSVERVSTYRQTFLGPTVGAVLAPLGVLVVVAVAVDPVTAGLLALAIPAIPLAIRGFQKAFRQDSAASRAARVRLAGRYLEAIQGLETITLLGAAPRVEADLTRVGEDNRRATMRLLARNQLVILVTDGVFSLAVIVAAAALAAWRLSSDALTIGGAVALMLCAVLLVQPLGVIGSFFYVAMGGRASQRAIGAFLAGRPDAGPRVPAAHRGPRPHDAHPDAAAGASVDHRDAGSNADPAAAASVATAIPHAANDLHIEVSEPTGSHVRRPSPAIEVRGAALGYGDHHVAEVTAFSVAPGERAVITGPSGGGKSTLLKTLKGEVVPTVGEVVVAGVPLTDDTRDAVRAASALVAQSTWLFTGTIAENLRLAGPDADDTRLWEALDLVDLTDFVRRGPQGLDTMIGERGLAVSGGQAQRLSLARAFLSRRPILLLDEPTSQVDLASEEVILDALERLSADHTVVLVTHRESSSAGADSHWQMRAGTLHRTPDADASSRGAEHE